MGTGYRMRRQCKNIFFGNIYAAVGQLADNFFNAVLTVFAVYFQKVLKRRVLYIYVVAQKMQMVMLAGTNLYGRHKIYLVFLTSGPGTQYALGYIVVG